MKTMDRPPTSITGVLSILSPITLGLGLASLLPVHAVAQEPHATLYLPLVGDGIPLNVDPNAFWADSKAPLVFDIADDPKRGEMLAATNAGVWIFGLADGSQRRLSKTDGLASNQVRSVAIDDAGRRWFATMRERNNVGQASGPGGLDRLDSDGTWTHFGSDDGLPSEDMRSLIPAVGGGVHAGGQDGIVRIFPDDRVVAFRHSFGGAWQEINDLAFEDTTLWIATSHGAPELRSGLGRDLVRRSRSHFSA